MQLNLAFLDPLAPPQSPELATSPTPCPVPGPWETLEAQAKRQALDILARLIARTLDAAQKTEASHE